MSDTKWTKGPWETDKDDHDQPYLEFRIHPKGNPSRKICEVWQDDAPVADYNREQVSNAHLIAAAPELYDALQEACVWDSHDDDGVPSVWLKIAQKALAKARGENQ